ncbi:MAG: GIY-YIG nuclease family protein [Candidatus Arsenophonus phytopathogenicus]
MAKMTKQGSVYIVSNVGSFGEDVFKVGMKRRLEPMEKISELNSANVPFEFDVHAMISSDDAPSLEKAIHNDLNSNRLNKVNFRKEFFKVNINEIIKSVKINHGEIEYVSNPIALQYSKTIEKENELGSCT